MFRTKPTIKGLLGDRKGAVALEFAVAAPILAAIFVVTVDLGRVVYDDMSVSAAARAGAQYALSKPEDVAGVQAAALASGGLSAGAVADAQKFCECPSGTAVSCTGSCPDGRLLTFVMVTVSQTFTTILPYPGLPSAFQLEGRAVLRVS